MISVVQFGYFQGYPFSNILAFLDEEAGPGAGADADADAPLSGAGGGRGAGKGVRLDLTCMLRLNGLSSTCLDSPMHSGLVGWIQQSKMKEVKRSEVK